MIVVVGLSHRTAPIEVRERAALPEEQLAEFLQHLVNTRDVGEALVVSTCNRMEVIAAPRAGAEALSASLEAVTQTLTGRIPGVVEHLYRLSGNEALHHLFSVAASLDSMVMGEPQILGQVKDALEAARRAGTVGPQLARAVGHAVRAAKRVRSETAIGAGQVSVPSVAVELARQNLFGSLEGRTGVLIGSGEMGEAAAKLLTQAGARLIIVGRNRERTEQLCRELGGEARGLDDLQATLIEADVVITATSKTGYLIDRESMKAVHKKRRGRTLFIIDLAVPRDVEPEVNELESVYLYNVDDLSEIVQQSLSSRQREAERAFEILSQEMASFERSLSAELVTPTVLALRGRVENTLRAELERTFKGRLKHLGKEEYEALSKMVEASVNKLLHAPTQKLRELAQDPGARFELSAQLSLLDELFDLEASSEPHAQERPAPAEVAAPPALEPSPEPPPSSEQPLLDQPLLSESQGTRL